jgi:hypothetical protein
MCKYEVVRWAAPVGHTSETGGANGFWGASVLPYFRTSVPMY